MYLTVHGPLVNVREVRVLLPFLEISLVPGDRPGPFFRMPLRCDLISRRVEWVLCG